MASFIPAANTVRVEQLFNLDESINASCRFYLQYSGTAPTGAELAAVAGACTTSVDSNLAPLMYHLTGPTGTKCTDLTSDTGAEGEVTDSTGGGLTGGPLPVDACLVVSSEIARRYRGGHPRVYLPVGDDTKLTNPLAWDPTFVTAVQSAWQTIIGDTSVAFPGHAGTITAVAPSFYSGYTNVPYGTPTKYRRTPTPRATALIQPVVTWVGRGYIGSQRRRRPATG